MTAAMAVVVRRLRPPVPRRMRRKGHDPVDPPAEEPDGGNASRYGTEISRARNVGKLAHRHRARSATDSQRSPLSSISPR